jgi:hypothetical protein
MTDLRTLVARMADELDYYRQLLVDDRRETHALAVEARAALAEFPPPAGEVAELVEWLRGQDGGLGRRAMSSRAADLLERLAQDHSANASKMVEPIPVSERLPEGHV